MSDMLTHEEVYLREVNDASSTAVLCAMYAVMLPEVRARTFLWFARHRHAKAVLEMLIAGNARELHVEDAEGRDAYYHIVHGLCVEECVPQYDSVQLHGEYMRVFRALSTYEDAQYSLVNGVRGNGWTPLIQACTFSAYRIVQLLLSKGADTNVQGVKGITPLMQASLRNDVQLAEILLKHGANPHLMDVKGSTAYAHACTQKNGEMMTLR
jgi:hypothetical protein